MSESNEDQELDPNKIVAVTHRPIIFLEAKLNSRSVAYTFGVPSHDLETGDHEAGEGELIYAAKIDVKDDGTIEIENFGITPVKLLGVRRLT